MSQIGLKTWLPQTNVVSQWTVLQMIGLPHPLPYHHKIWWVGSQLDLEFVYQSMLSSTYRGAINATHAYLKDHWTEFHQIWYACSRGEY